MTIENIADKVIEADVLVIGGGVAGPFAALFASEGGASQVVLLEKAAVRRSGATGMGIHGWHQVLPDEIKLEDIAKDITAIGRKYMGTIGYLPIAKGLINENLIYVGYRDNWDAVHALERWGFSMKWEHDQYHFHGFPENHQNRASPVCRRIH